MRIDIEVRSSGWGPRTPFRAGYDGPRVAAFVENCSKAMAATWTRTGLDHKGRTKRLCDGVAVIIRRAE